MRGLSELGSASVRDYRLIPSSLADDVDMDDEATFKLGASEEVLASLRKCRSAHLSLAADAQHRSTMTGMRMHC